MEIFVPFEMIKRIRNTGFQTMTLLYALFFVLYPFMHVHYHAEQGMKVCYQAKMHATPEWRAGAECDCDHLQGDFKHLSNSNHSPIGAAVHANPTAFRTVFAATRLFFCEPVFLSIFTPLQAPNKSPPA